MPEGPFCQIRAHIYCISVYKLFLSYSSAVFLLKFYRVESTKGAKRLGGKTTSGVETTRRKRPGGKRLGGETTRGGNGLGAKRLRFVYTGGHFLLLYW